MDADQQQLASRVLSGSLASASGSSGSKRNERVWVAVRIRPLLELEQLAHEKVAWKPLSSTTLQYVDAERPQQAGTYQYNRVFPEASTSGEVYQAAARSLVTATMRGYNSTIFAYGQTGSGKTYTMQSIMHAAAEDVFSYIAGAAGREFVIRLSAVEIYNEVVRDLLRDASPALRVQDDPGKGVVAEGLTEAGVQSVEHLRQLLREVEGRRQTRATRMNDNSSRSHEIVRLYVESRPLPSSGSDCSSDAGSSDGDDLPAAPDSGGAAATAGGGSAAAAARSGSRAAPVLSAALNFVDLAGSERCGQAASGGPDDGRERLRQQEAGNINKSLLTLGSVIRTLGDSGAKRHVPYRDSKLTRLLQSSLSGNSHMAIITTVSPAGGSADNTKAALHFANAAKRVTMRPQLNQVADSRTLLRSMAAEIQALKQQLAGAVDPQGLCAALAAKEEQVKESAAEVDALRSKLRHLQNQILRGTGAIARWEGALSTDNPAWGSRAKIAKQLRASCAGPLTSSRQPALAGRDVVARPSTSCCPRSSSSMAPPPAAPAAAAGGGSQLYCHQQQQQQGPPALSPVRSSMRLLQCYLSIDAGEPAAGRGAAAITSAAAAAGRGPGLLPVPAGMAAPVVQRSILGSVQMAGGQRYAPQQQQQYQQNNMEMPVSRLGAMNKQQQQQQPEQEEEEVKSPGEAPRSIQEAIRQQLKHLQEPSGPEAEAALAGLEAEARCYQAVAQYSLGELAAALEGLEAAVEQGAGLGSWTGEQLAALRSEVGRKRAAAALTQLGDAALQALERKMASYRSDEAGGAYEELGQQLGEASSSRGDLEGEGTSGSSRDQLGYDSWPSRPLPGNATPEPIRPATAATAAAGRGGSRGSPDLLDGGPSNASSSRSGAAAPASLGPSSSSGAVGVGVGVGGLHRAATPGGAGGVGVDAREQLLRLQEAFRSSVEKDVSCLREVLVQYKEHIERLEIQKKVLLNQVLKLEFALEEEEGAKQQLQRSLQTALVQRDAARSAAAAAAAAGGGVLGGGSGSTNGGACSSLHEGAHLPPLTIPPPGAGAVPGPRHLSIFDHSQEDAWASTPTQSTLLPRIVALWEELYVPLVYRSRFFLAFRGREVFYYEVEHRRLEWKKAAMLRGLEGPGGDLLEAEMCGSSMPGTPQTGASGAPRVSASQAWGSGGRRHSKQLDRAARALDWERKNLAAQLKWGLTEGEREELYSAWGVDPDTKERKLQLAFKLWAPETIAQPEGMQRSSELVVMLCGMDASEHMMELVFGDYEREYSLGAAGSAMGQRPSSSLGYAMSSVMRRMMPPRSSRGGGGGGGSPARSMAGLRAPSRMGSFTSRIQSGFMSLIASRDGGLGEVGGMRGGGGGGSFTSVSSLGWNAGASNLGR